MTAGRYKYTDDDRLPISSIRELRQVAPIRVRDKIHTVKSSHLFVSNPISLQQLLFALLTWPSFTFADGDYHTGLPRFKPGMEDRE